MALIGKLLQTASKEVGKKLPEILTGFGVVGVVSTAASAVAATPKVLDQIEKEAWARIPPNCNDPETAAKVVLSKKDIFKLSWKYYIPAAMLGAATIACICGANSVSRRRLRVLSAAYALSEAAYHEYRDKISGVVGKKKEERLKDEIATDAVNANPSGRNEVIVTGGGDQLCYDRFSGRYFKSDIEKIRKAVNDFNARLLGEMFTPLNDFYEMIGLGPIDAGFDNGFDITKGEQLSIQYTACIADDGRPCIVLTYEVKPHYIY